MDDLNTYLKEAQEYIKKDNSVQASEKIYKIVEDCIKLLAKEENLPEYEEAKKEGTWWTKLLSRAAYTLGEKLKEKKFEEVWCIAFNLHRHGFHEKALDTKIVKENIWIAEWIVNYTKNYLNSKNG